MKCKNNWDCIVKPGDLIIWRGSGEVRVASMEEFASVFGELTVGRIPFFTTDFLGEYMDYALINELTTLDGRPIRGYHDDN